MQLRAILNNTICITFLMSILWARNFFSRLKAENLALNPSAWTFSSVLRGPAGPYLWELFSAKVGPAGCNKFPDEILEGRSPGCRLTHLSGPMLVVRFPGPLHLCRRPSHPVGGGAGAVMS
jgi:hypothetical protein